jgi:hypothetical protein
LVLQNIISGADMRLLEKRNLLVEDTIMQHVFIMKIC